MSQNSPLKFNIPTEFTQEHHDALMAYLIDDRFLKAVVWRQLFKGIDRLTRPLS